MSIFTSISRYCIKREGLILATRQLTERNPAGIFVPCLEENFAQLWFCHLVIAVSQSTHPLLLWL
uniref:Uncharacterized protein n=1 Tax=Arundo donax TaxID=35708 RepID=A0A0A9CAH8_ARUDO